MVSLYERSRRQAGAPLSDNFQQAYSSRLIIMGGSGAKGLQLLRREGQTELSLP
jgi:hypothetical protein